MIPLHRKITRRSAETYFECSKLRRIIAMTATSDVAHAVEAAP